MENLPDLSGTRVLVVDDEPFFRSMIIRVLEKIGFADIAEATDGVDGLAKLQSVAPDLVVLDVMMEPMNGLKFLKSVRVGMSSAAADLPVVILTGSTEEAVLGVALALDCNAFVRKTDSPEILKDRIIRVLCEESAVKSAIAYHGVQIPDITMNVPPPPRAERKSTDTAGVVEVSIDEVEAGAILDQDVFTEEGHLLFAAGTALSSAYLDRLRDISEIIELPLLSIRRAG